MVSFEMIGLEGRLRFEHRTVLHEQTIRKLHYRIISHPCDKFRNAQPSSGLIIYRSCLKCVHTKSITDNLKGGVTDLHCVELSYHLIQGVLHVCIKGGCTTHHIVFICELQTLI